MLNSEFKQKRGCHAEGENRIPFVSGICISPRLRVEFWFWVNTLTVADSVFHQALFIDKLFHPILCPRARCLPDAHTFQPDGTPHWIA